MWWGAELESRGEPELLITEPEDQITCREGRVLATVFSGASLYLWLAGGRAGLEREGLAGGGRAEGRRELRGR